jgi:hypothetical protein
MSVYVFTYNTLSSGVAENKKKIGGGERFVARRLQLQDN